MDGPIIVHFILYIIVPVIWVYKRFFETAGLESKELIEVCEGRPTLAVLRVQQSRASVVVARLEERLGRRRELAVTLGRWPWTHHVIAVEVIPAGAEVRLVATGCRVRRIKESPPVPITELLLDAMREFGLGPGDSWLDPRTYGHQLGVEAPDGWRLLPESAQRFPLEPWNEPRSFAGKVLEPSPIAAE